MGYHNAGFTVIGVDNRRQPRYPFEFHQADALGYLQWLIETGEILTFDGIHASPPCQRYSVLRHAAEKKGKDKPDLISPTRELLRASLRPWIIENVPGAPLEHPVTLCGSMFGLGAVSGNGENIPRMFRQLRRHRLFEASFPISPPIRCDHWSKESLGVYGHDPAQVYFGNRQGCQHKGEALGVYGGAAVGRYTFGNGAPKDYYNRRGGYQGTMPEKRQAMGIDWMTREEINQAIPPAYTEHLGLQLIYHLKSRVTSNAASPQQLELFR